MREHDHLEEPARAAGERDRPAVDDTTWRQAAGAGLPDVLGPAGLLRLQRAAGNRVTTGLADEPTAQRDDAAGAGAARSPVLDVVSSGGGRPLEPPVRAEMESRLGHGFGDVRIHTDDAAHRSAQAVDAHAYTVGSDVVFQRDGYDPSSREGLTTLAHELTHVVQQRTGPVDGTPTGDGVSVSDPSDRFEREATATAERVMADPAPATGAVQRDPDDAPARGASLQREQEEEPLQGSFVQREQEDEEEPLQGSFVQREQAEEDELPA